MSRKLGTAAETGDLDALTRLLDDGADIEWSRGRGRTALVEAAIAGHTEAVALLLERGAAVDTPCVAVGLSALGWAAETGSSSIAALLVERGAALDLLALETRRTALMSAAQAGHDGVVELLLAAGADPDLVDAYGDNAWSLAQENGHTAVVSLLDGVGAGAPEPVVLAPALPWPPEVPGVDATADPATVVRAYTLAMHDWERGSAEAVDRARRDPDSPGLPDLGALVAESDAIRARFCTPRRRAYAKSSFGWPTEYAPDDELVDVRTVSASRAEVVTRDVPTRARTMRYEHRFVVRRVAGAWLVDSVTTRPLGHEKWERAYL